MNRFLRLLSENNKTDALKAACKHLHQRENNPRSFEVVADLFGLVSKKPVAYCVSESVRQVCVNKRGIHSNVWALRETVNNADPTLTSGVATK